MELRNFRVLALGLFVSIFIAGCALNREAEIRVRGATLEVVSKTSPRFGLVGTAFSMEPGRIVTAAHTLNGFIGSQFGEPVIRDSAGVEYRVESVVRYDTRQDFAVLTLNPPPQMSPLERSTARLSKGNDLAFAGRVPGGGITIQDANYLGTTPQPPTGPVPSVDFAGTVWQGISGGPLFERQTGAVVGMIVMGVPNRAVPVDTILNGDREYGRIYPAEVFEPLGMKRFSDAPLTREIPLPQPFQAFAADVESRRKGLYDDVLGRLLDPQSGKFVMIGPGASENCQILSGGGCSCPSPSGPERLGLSLPRPNGMVVRRLRRGSALIHNIEGAIVIRDRTRSARLVKSIADDVRLHFALARRGLNEPELALKIRINDSKIFTALAEGTPKGQVYTDSSGRAWQQRTWALSGTDYVLVSLARDLPNGHVVLMRAVPRAYEYGCVLQLKFVVNYAYACDTA